MMVKLLFLLYLKEVGCLNNKLNLISRFVNATNQKFYLLMLCWSDSQKIILQKDMHLSSDVRTLFLKAESKISDVNIQYYNGISFVVDLDCAWAQKKLYYEETQSVKFRYSHSWLIMTDRVMHEENVREIFFNTSLRLDSRVKFTALDKDGKNVRIFDVYRQGADVRATSSGTFGTNDVTISKKQLSFYNIRKNMKGVFIRTGNRVNYSIKTEEYLKEIKSKDTAEFQIFNFQLFLILKEVHNFRHNTTLSNAWFGNTTTGNDAGIAKLLYDNIIDLSTSGGFMRVARVDYYDFLVPVYKFKSAFIFVNPGKTKPGTEVLKPFSATTWYVFMLITASIGTTIYIANWVEYKFIKRDHDYTFCTSLLITISVITQQGSSIVPSRFGGRIIFLTLLMMSIMVYNYYTSSLVSSLLSSIPEVIHTIKELYESNLKVAIEPQPYTFTYILQQKNDRFISLLNSTKIYEDGTLNALPPGEGIAKVKRKNYAYHTELATAYSCLKNSDQELICDLAEINFLPDGDIGMVAQKNSEFTEIFQITLISGHWFTGRHLMNMGITHDALCPRCRVKNELHSMCWLTVNCSGESASIMRPRRSKTFAQNAFQWDIQERNGVLAVKKTCLPAKFQSESCWIKRAVTGILDHIQRDNSSNGYFHYRIIIVSP